MAASNVSEISPDDAWNAAKLLNKPADEFGNDPNVEAWWAFQASKHMEVYFNLLRSVDPLHLKLTRYDDEIYTKFRETFPDLKIDKIQEEELKSEEVKEKWRPFCEIFKDVDDYNFGTMLRADSAQEYSDENTLLVPRIQFYAIEIARNREGCNNQIRFEYKVTESTVGSLLRFLRHGRGVRATVRPEDGSSSRGDISVLVRETSCEKVVEEMGTIATSGWPMSVKCCKFVPPCRLQLNLDRPTIIKEIITEVCSKGRNYGFSCTKRNKNVLIVSSFLGDSDGVAQLRTQFLSLHLLQLLQADGYDVSVIDPVVHNVRKCANCTNIDALFMQCEKAVEGAYTTNDEILIDLCNSAQPILLKKGENHSVLFNQVIKLEHFVRCHIMQEPDFVIHVVPETHSHFQEQIGYLWGKIRHRIQHMYIVHGKVFSKLMPNELRRNQVKVLEEAWEHRFGENIPNTQILDILADTAIKFKFLSIGHSSVLNVDKSTDKKVGVFVQYNCARLAMIFRRFEDGVDKHVYHGLPSVECVDYSLLKQEEWKLLYNYVLPFQHLTSEALQKITDFHNSLHSKLNLPLHKVCHMLQHLIKDLSHYYSKRQILVDCRSDLMAARLRAMQAVQQVLHNALWLLQVEPLERM